MTAQQMLALTHELRCLIYDPRAPASHFDYHHGDCIGADKEFHTIILDIVSESSGESGGGSRIGIEGKDDGGRKTTHKIWIHPPHNDGQRAYCSALKFHQKDEGRGSIALLPKQAYLVRNQQIAGAAHLQIGAPHTFKEEMRSGTWATIRYAYTRRKPLLILWPDGSLTRSYS